MLIPKYHNYNFYVHNLGEFDVIFIHKILKEFNLINNNYYIYLSFSIKLNSSLK